MTDHPENHMRHNGPWLWLSGDFVAGMLAVENAQAEFDKCKQAPVTTTNRPTKAKTTNWKRIRDALEAM